MDSLKSIPLPPTSTIPLPQDNQPKLVITSSTSGERSVSTVQDARLVTTVQDVKEDGSAKTHKEKKKHKKEKHKHKHKHKDKGKSREKKHPLITPQVLSQHASAIKAAMLKEVQSESSDVALSQSIVDDLFKDFLATKMNEIESAYKRAAEKKDAEGDVANSVEEMNKLLDEELDTISQNTPSPVKKNKGQSSSLKNVKSEKSIDSASNIKSEISSESLSCVKSSKTMETISSVVKSQDEFKSEKGIHDTNVETKLKSETVTLNSGCEGNSVILIDKDLEGEKDIKCVPLEIKKPGKLQLAFKISETSAQLISSGAKTEDKPTKGLEEGEVISSGHGSSSDSDSADENDDDDADISETGSLSDSEKESKDKSKRKKKKKKHKKKKKKHKIAREKDKEDIESKSKRKHSSHRSRSRSKSPKKHRRSRSPSKEKRKRSRSRSFSPEHSAGQENRKRDRSRSFSPEHGVWRTSKHKHDRERSRERDEERRHDNKYDKHRYDRDHDRQRSRERDSERRYGKWRSRSRSRERRKDKSRDSEDLRLKIDKAKLREIAMKNALAMAKAGQGSIAGVDFASIKAGGKSIDELTEFCARIAAKEKLKNRPPGLTSSSSSDDDGKKSDDDELIHHPFKVQDKAITMNIRNATPMPILSAQEKITQQATLRLQFPVSSGNVHRTKEMEWVPVEKTETVKTTSVSTTAVSLAIPAGELTASSPAVPAVATEVKLMPVKEEDKVFVEQPPESVDISSIISERIKAARKLAENPQDREAMSAMQRAQHKANLWANSKNLPGKFIGSTGAQILSQEELMGPDKKRQAWAKKVGVACQGVLISVFRYGCLFYNFSL